MRISRRRLVAGAAAAAAGWALRAGAARADDPGAPAGGDAEAERRRKDAADLVAPMPRRKLGATGVEVGVLALGSAPLGNLPDDQEEAAVAVVRRALELGVDYLDTAPSYGAHRAERRIGAAIRGRRDGLIVATKSYLTAKDDALKELEASLKALGTDRVDVFQVHAVGDDEDRKRKLDAEKGTLAAALAARKAGKCRFVGVTGHADPEVMAACLAEFPFDTVLVPVNCADPLRTSFVEGTLAVARERKTAVVAMKVFAAGQLVARATPEECLRFTLSQDVATATAGVTTVAELEADVLAAKRFRTMPADEQRALTSRFSPHPGKSLEWYKKA
jgi:aryl-alcohol dehydrogenase-like predicted oxidoreductase